MTTLFAFLADYRRLSATEEKSKLARMFLLVDFFPLNIVWQDSGHLSWAAFLRAEQLCPPAYFASFHDATKLYAKSVIEEIGADAAVTLARIEPQLRASTLKMIRSYTKTHRAKPHFRRVYLFVRALRSPIVARKSKGKTVYATKH